MAVAETLLARASLRWAAHALGCLSRVLLYVADVGPSASQLMERAACGLPATAA